MTYTIYMVHKGKRIKVQGGLQYARAKRYVIGLNENCIDYSVEFYLQSDR